MLARHRLQWRGGVGWLDPVNPIEYGRDYFEEYRRRAATEVGKAINQGRVALVGRHYDGDDLCDIGIGCGAFISARPKLTFGYDVNPYSVAWLESRGLYRNPYRRRSLAVSFWDVIEHIPDYWRILENVDEWLFASLPIFTDESHALRSKHFKPGEHCWYWTAKGFENSMENCGFKLVARSCMESDLGREDIETFVFRRQ